MKTSPAQFSSFDFILADGSRWTLLPQDALAAELVQNFSNIMQLPACRYPGDPIRVASQPASPNGGETGAIYILRQVKGRHKLITQLIDLSILITRQAQHNGAVLLHAALAEYHGCGVLLAAPGGTGKTTASRRLPLPWHSLCDDASLVVRDSGGNYWAHPWPTWSRVADSPVNVSWDVQRAVPLAGLFFLSQAQQDHVSAIGPGQALTMLAQSAKQVYFSLPDEDAPLTRSLRVQRFENLCALVQKIPAHRLEISRKGQFWREIERALDVES